MQPETEALQMVGAEDTELYALAVSFLNSAAREKLIGLLRPSDFYLPSHGSLFAAVSEMHQAGRGIDPVTVAEYLRGERWFADAGGTSFLHMLASMPALAAHATEYAEILRHHSRERQTVEIGNALAARCLSPAEGIERLRELDAAATAGLPFVTAQELADQAPEKLRPVVPPWVYGGMVAEMTAKIKAGKTTWAHAATWAVVTGGTLLEHQAAQGPVLYLTEQNRASFGAQLNRANLLGCPDLHVLFRHEYRADWPAIAAGVRQRAREVGAVLVIVDTLGAWAALGPEAENDAGAAQAAMDPIHEIAAAGPAVLVLRHERKSGGEIGDSARGSSAFGGSADVLMVLRKLTSPGHENRRELLALGRVDGIPAKVVLEYREGEYVLLGDGGKLERQDAREKVLELLPATREHALSFDALLERCDGVTRTTLHRAVVELEAECRVNRERGAGGAGKGYGHWLAEGGL